MRAFQGQMSDNQPIRRTPQEKKKLLVELEDTLKALKPTAAPSHKTKITARIAELKAELTNASTDETPPTRRRNQR